MKRGKQDELFFEKNETLPSVEEWVSLGRPKLYVLEREIDQYKIYSDAAFGGLMVSFPNGRVINKGMLFVNDLVILDSPYTGTKEIGIFRKI